MSLAVHRIYFSGANSYHQPLCLSLQPDPQIAPLVDEEVRGWQRGATADRQPSLRWACARTELRQLGAVLEPVGALEGMGVRAVHHSLQRVHAAGARATTALRPRRARARLRCASAQAMYFVERCRGERLRTMALFHSQYNHILFRSRRTQVRPTRRTSSRSCTWCGDGVDARGRH